MEQTPKANRVHIGFFGCCNAGKSTLINMLTDQPVSLVSEVAGTTTDPVSKSMEILPLGPVVITDTAGIDDTSELGALRIEKSEEVIKKINLAVYVLRDDEAPTADDMMWLNKLKQNNVPIALFINEINGSHGESTNNNQNLANESNGTHQGYIDTYPELAAIATVVGSTDFTSNRDRLTLLDLLGGLTPLDVEGEQSLLQGLVDPGDTIILVCPIDSAAPKGRLILPQVQ
ncbi:MAG: GTP-binding protein, partial [Peptoniphilaceae bacterium]|nr:GTP-binding protein [Peptoniphilaceae bacterium]